jgi:hypothetical protein
MFKQSESTDTYICGQEQDEADIVRSIRAVPEAREGSCDSRRIMYRLPHRGHGGSYVPGQHSGVPIGGPCLVVGGEMLLMGERRKCEGCGRRRHLRSCAALMGQQMPANCGLGLVNLQQHLLLSSSSRTCVCSLHLGHVLVEQFRGRDMMSLRG